MTLKKLTLQGFKSFAKKSEFLFNAPVVSIVGPNGSGKSNVVESIQFVLGEQSMKSMRGGSSKDLIFAGSKKIGKMSRARVDIVFDNSNKIFSLPGGLNKDISLDFDEITVAREVYSDGSSKYLLNGHEVRLKDIQEVIASVNIGASGHHIISQGGADRLLNASAKDRKGMIEDALGLRLYHYRIKETRRNLDKTELNLRETNIMRRELAPHMNFLRKQVEKIEKSKELRAQLLEQYKKYFKYEEFVLDNEQTEIDSDAVSLRAQVKQLEEKRDHLAVVLEQAETKTDTRGIEELEEKLRTVTVTKEQTARALGKLEAKIEILEDRKKDTKENKGGVDIPFFDFERFSQSVLDDLESVGDLQDLASVQRVTNDIKKTMASFVAKYKKATPNNDDIDTLLQDLVGQRISLASELEQGTQGEADIRGQIAVLRQEFSEGNKEAREKEREYFGVTNELGSLKASLDIIALREKAVSEHKENFRTVYAEAEVLLGGEVSGYQDILLGDMKPTRSSQNDLFRNVERLKFRLEDLGGGSGADVIKEYKEAKERDEFLEREIEDLKSTIESLLEVVASLEERLAKDFKVGVEKINAQFTNFFTAMFGGGKAKLELVTHKKRRRGGDEDADDDEADEEEGVEIRVALPRKKVRDLGMLSGGERSLTSIALLFSLSQVNPPPFLVLDETDAALDEANSRRYGDMIVNLSRLSQLILVTHNRETMSRAQVLYGVTLGGDDASTLLSVQLEDAMQYAK